MEPPIPLRLRFGAFELDEREARLTRGGEPVALAPKVLALLCELARHPAQLVRKAELLDAVWGHRFVTESVLKTAIRDLRAALGDDAKQPQYIETASRHGYRFIAALREAGSAPPPAAVEPAAAAHPAALPGRGSAGERLHAAWATAQQGRRQLVWLSGEAGIGKSTLIERFIAELAPVRWAQGQCVEQRGAGEPYLPVLEAVSALCRAEPALAALLRQIAPTWLLQLPWLTAESEREALRRELAGTGQERMLREFGEWLDRVAEQRPLLLVTEDLHWSDQATLRLMDHVARRRAPTQLMWLASFRLADVQAGDGAHPMKALRHELRQHRLAQEIALDPLSEREVGDCIADSFPGQPVPEALVRDLHVRTDGLPLFVVSVIDDWQARSHRLPQADALARALPESLAEVIEAQVQRLADDERQLLEAASACGVEFGITTLAAALDEQPIAIDERCEHLARRRQWLAAQALEHGVDGAVEARYAFRHAVVRQVIYERIGALRRNELHRRIAQSLARRREAGEAVAAAELALHHERSHELAAALACYGEAAEAALRRFAPHEALGLSSHGLALLASWPENEVRWSLEIGLQGPRAAAASQLDGITAPPARAAYERLEWLFEQLPQRGARGPALGYGWSLFVTGQYGLALERAARQLADAERRGDGDLELAACHLHGATLSFLGRLPEARHWLERGLRALGAAGDRPLDTWAAIDLEPSLHARHAMLLARMGEPAAAEGALAAAHARADRIAQPYARRLVLIFEGFVAMRMGQAERVCALAQEIRSIADVHAIAQAQGPARWMLGWAMARLGEPLAGHALILEGYALDQQLQLLRGRSGVLALAAEALMLAGRHAEAQAQLDDALALAERMGERLHLPEMLLLRSRLQLERGERTAATSAAREAWQEAAHQQALWLELEALLALCRIEPLPAHREALATARSRLTEGADHELVRAIDALLAAADPDRIPTER